jgi:hypothetical protein
MEINPLRKFFTSLLLSTLLSCSAFAETVNMEASPPTVPSVGSWSDYWGGIPPSGIASLFDGYPSGQAACDGYATWLNSSGGGGGRTVFYFVGSDISGQCRRVNPNNPNGWDAWIFPAYYQNCRLGYSYGSYIASATPLTCVNYSAPKQCPIPIIHPEVPYTPNPDGLTCSRPDVMSCPITDLTTDPTDPNGLNALSKYYKETAVQAQLTQSLEGGLNGYSLLSPKTQSAEQCLAGRVASELLQADSGYKVTATVRTLAYQAHLLAVWKKFFELQDAIKNNPAIGQQCPALIAQVEGEMGFRLTQNPTDKKSTCTASGRNHCLVQQPSSKDPKHTQNIAFDISKATVDKFNNILLPPRSMTTEANACNLTWGGTFKDQNGKPKPDPVHFVCCIK